MTHETRIVFLYNLLPDQPHISQTMAVYLQTCLDTEISATCQCVEEKPRNGLEWKDTNQQ